MTSKFEYKYLVPTELLDNIRAEIRPYVEPDRFTICRNPREYTVRSIYWDTRRLDCYYEKLEGVRVRRKFRVRGYNQPDTDSTTFLEIKRKHDNLVCKTRAAVLWSDLGKVLDSHAPLEQLNLSADCQKEDDASRSFLYHYHRYRLTPTVLVVYDREAFLGRFDPTFRITFDKNLRSSVGPTIDSLYDEAILRPVMRDHFVLEVKFPRGLPAWIRSIVERFQLSRMAVSKYAICLRSHGPVENLTPRLLCSHSTPHANTNVLERETT